MPKFSIIIPTYNHLEDCLKPCIESIKQFTNLDQVEVIVVANGCTDGTEEYVMGLGEPFILYNSVEALGYTKAMNIGMKMAQGEYIVPLNNDTVLLPQTKNQWLDMLAAPMVDPKVRMSGPMLTWCPEAKRNFLIFFCVCIHKEMFEKFGYLDEIFSPGYGEDTDYCCRIEDGGYKFVSVTENAKMVSPTNMVGDFPIYHKGNVTFRNWVGGEELLRHNNEILRQRYALNTPNIEKALKCDGFMSEKELMWLGNESKKRKVIIEIGSWHGRSSRALGDNLMEGGTIYCVDTWNGSAAEQTTNHQSAKWKDGDHAFYEFCQNNMDLIAAKKIVPVRMSSKNASDLFKEMNIQADMIFIDAGHTYPEVCEDIDAWKDLIKDDGIFCGHDFNAWIGVNQAVSDKITAFNVGIDTTIWYCNRENIHFDTPKVFDCFPFNNEFELLEKRLSTLWDVVDRFVIVESIRTHANLPKPLNFNDNLSRFEKYLSKITYIVVEDNPPGDSWAIERHQRDCILRGLNGCKGNDIVLISDCDEIPSPEAIKSYNPIEGIKSLEMDLYYYNKHTKAKDKWTEGKIGPYRLIREMGPCQVRYTQCPVIPNAGEHMSYSVEGMEIEAAINKIIKKIEDTAHQEYNRPEIKDRNRIKQAILSGTDVFGRDNILFESI